MARKIRAYRRKQLHAAKMQRREEEKEAKKQSQADSRRLRRREKSLRVMQAGCDPTAELTCVGPSKGLPVTKRPSWRLVPRD